jgi:hypothetical protein
MSEISIQNVEVAERDMLHRAIERVLMWGTFDTAEIYCEPRVPDTAPDYKFPGRLEYLLVINYRENHKIVIGMLQREKGAEVEFHS